MGSYFKSNQRKLVSALAAAIFVAIGIGFCSVPKAFAKYSGGTGEPSNPYRIATAEDLNDIGNYEEDWDKHFILINDVNLATYTGTQFNIISRWLGWDDPNNKPFVGVFDGNDHKIWNLTWDSNDIYVVGLFGYVGSNGQVKNLGLENVDVNAVNGNFIGGLVGYNYHGLVANCRSSGNISGNARYVGGLVGYNDGEIAGCFSTGSISGYDYVGGMVGLNDGIISDCQCAGSVLGRGYVGGVVGSNKRGSILACSFEGLVSSRGSYCGGIAGINWSRARILGCFSAGVVSGPAHTGGLTGGNSSGLISEGVVESCYSASRVEGDWITGGLVGLNKAKVSNSYSEGSVSGSDTVGGLIGSNGTSTLGYGRISRCYSNGPVLGTTNVGGLVGLNDSGFVEDSFWDIETSGRPTSAGGEPKTTAEMKTMSTFTDAGWDFVEIWGIGENQTYPFLRTEPAGDSNYDGKVDLADLAILASHWLARQPF